MLSEIKQYLQFWIDQPVPSLIAIVVGGVAGHFLSQTRHYGKISTLEERLKLRDDEIAIKNRTIQTLSSDGKERVNEEKFSIAKERSLFAKPPPPLGSKGVQTNTAAIVDPRFARANVEILNALEAQMRKTLLGSRFKFVFNPQTGKSKFLTFLENGDIGEGRNDNEHHWRVVDGKLEIIEASNYIHSRFVLLNDGKTLHHTNDADTRSIKGQYMMVEA